MTEGNTIYGVAAEMNFRTVDWVYGIQESKDTGSTVQTASHDFNPASMGVTCIQEVSPRSQSYRLCHWVDYGKISVYEVEFVTKDVFVRTTFPGNVGVNIPVSSIGTFVDSFVPASPPSDIVRGI